MRAGLGGGSEDESTDEVGTGEGGLGSGVEDVNMDMLPIRGRESERESEQESVKHMARKHAGNLKGKGKAPMRTKAQIMQSVEGGDGLEEDGGDEEDYDDEILKELEGMIPFARGGTEESEGGDYNPLLESFQAKNRRSSSEPREKRMRY